MVWGTPFRIEETVEATGVVRLALEDELDLSTRNAVEVRLHELSARRAAVCIDLSRLEFIDASGLRVLVSAFADARRSECSMELDPRLTPQVSRVLAVADPQLL